MDFGQTLRTLRKERKLSQQELADKVGVSASCLSKWETGFMLPTQDNLRILAKVLGVRPQQLHAPIREEPKRADSTFTLEKDEKKIITDFRSLDSFGKRAVLLILKNERQRMKESTRSGQHKKPAHEVKRMIRLYTLPAAAGYSAAIDESEFTLIPAGRSVPAGADFAVRVQGNSMLPYLKDGDYAYVKSTEEIAIGEIGLFSVNGAQYCKMYYKTGSGDVWLVSTNEALAGSNVHIKADSDDTVKCHGKILMRKKVQLPDYFMNSIIKK